MNEGGQDVEVPSLSCSIDGELEAKNAGLSLVKFSPDTHPPAEFNFGVVIKVGDANFRQLHAGLLFRGSDGVLMVGDVRWHYDFDAAMALPEENWYWVRAPLSKFLEEYAAETIDFFVKKYKNAIPYSVASEGMLFCKGELLPLVDGQGLTCATFVTQFFEDIGAPLLLLDGWNDRDGDQEWRDKILSILSGKKEVRPEHIEAQRKRVDTAIRVRPEDAFGAANMKDFPVSFQQVMPISNEINRALLP